MQRFRGLHASEAFAEAFASDLELSHGSDHPVLMTGRADLLALLALRQFPRLALFMPSVRPP